MKQKPFLFRIDEDVFKETKQESKENGISMNRILNLKLKGLEIKNKNKK